MRYFKKFLFVFLPFFISCQPEPSSNLDTGDLETDYTGQEESLWKGDLDKNNPYNQLALFLAGKEAATLNQIQKQEYYRNYKSKLEQSWQKVTAKNLNSIKLWAKKNYLIQNDSLPLFYPFSGPDFLYANTFFPNSSTQILVGLENPGKLPILSKMDEKQISAYLYKLYQSLRYINQAGYFTTKQMQNDFTDLNMNGIIHLLCFYMAKTNHQIAKISPVQIDYYGQVKEKKNFEVADEFVNGIKFQYYSNEQKKFKTLYYFPLDLSDENIKDRLGFLMFVSNLGQKNTFMKSASYIMHSNEFGIIRDLVLKQSQSIVQDDSGIPYAALKNSGFDVELFGSYSRTIGVFKNYFQPDLKRALDKDSIANLPFKLGYNSWKDKMVLMVANYTEKTANKPVTYKTEKEGVIFKVQIKSSWKKIPDDSEMFKGLPKVEYYFSDNLYKYTIGNFASQEACDPYRQIAAKNGFIDAFVVAFYKKNRISQEEAERVVGGE